MHKVRTFLRCAAHPCPQLQVNATGGDSRIFWLQEKTELSFRKIMSENYKEIGRTAFQLGHMLSGRTIFFGGCGRGIINTLLKE